MRAAHFSMAMLLATFASGCGTIKSQNKDSGSSTSVNGTNNVLTTPVITPVNILSGRVVMVNISLRYIVIDFGVGLLPQPGQRLDVYRQGNKVGEVRISNQARSGNVAADIMLGEAAEGDEVRGAPPQLPN